jgi:hypothetical protein
MEGTQRPNLGNVLRRIQENDRNTAEDRDKVDQVFDLEIVDESLKPTAGEELDADFSETVKCFSFSVTSQNPPVKKNQSMKYNLNMPQVDDLEDSLNQRVSNPSESPSQKAGSFANNCFKNGSIHDSEKIDMKSGHFNISSSPSPIQQPGSAQQDQRPSAGSFMHHSPGANKSPKEAA